MNQQRRVFWIVKSMSMRWQRILFIAEMTKGCFRPWGRIAIVPALLFTSCASLTPERIDQLVAIASQAALVGSQIYLEQHPAHRDSFAQVAKTITAEKPSNEKAVTLLHSLPTRTLRGGAGELYISDRLVVWDEKNKKAVAVTGKAEAPVMRAVVASLKQASAPKPPAISRSALPRSITGVEALRAQPPANEIHVTNIVVHHWLTNVVIHEAPKIWVYHDQTNAPAQPEFTTNNWKYYTNNFLPGGVISNLNIGPASSLIPVRQVAPDPHAQRFIWVTNAEGRRGKLFLPQREPYPVK